jgi:hypothetical protein
MDIDKMAIGVTFPPGDRADDHHPTGIRDWS